MSLFGRRDEQPRARSAEEREQARREREARRRARSGDAPPSFDYAARSAPTAAPERGASEDGGVPEPFDDASEASVAEPAPVRSPRDPYDPPEVDTPAPAEESAPIAEPPAPAPVEEPPDTEEEAFEEVAADQPGIDEGEPAEEAAPWAEAASAESLPAVVEHPAPDQPSEEVASSPPPPPPGEAPSTAESPAVDEVEVEESPTVDEVEPAEEAAADDVAREEAAPHEAPAGGDDVAHDGEPDEPVAAPRPPAAITRFRRERVGRPGRSPSLPPRQPRTAATTPKEPKEPNDADESGETSSPRRWPVRVAAALALVLIVFLAWFAISLYQPFKGDGSTPVRVRVPSGLTAREIGDLLADRGVVSSGFFFALHARLDGKRDQLKAGAYTFRKDMKFSDAEAILVKGPPPITTVKLVLPEGNTERAFASAVDKSGKVRGRYMTAVRRARFSPRRYGAPAGSPLEGFLFPDTYELRTGRQATAQNLVNQQLATFKRNLRGVSMRRARAANLTTYDVLIIASMIEREAAIARDRPLIASVIYNRLKQSIPLGIDATIRYADNNWTRPLRVSELQRPGPYNTRLNQGLPPTPIGNPGLASIRAAANPARTRYLYFVVKPGGNGAHAFSSTYQQFLADQARYNQARNAAGGRDPSKG